MIGPTLPDVVGVGVEDSIRNEGRHAPLGTHWRDLSSVNRFYPVVRRMQFYREANRLVRKVFSCPASRLIAFCPSLQTE